MGEVRCEQTRPSPAPPAATCRCVTNCPEPSGLKWQQVFMACFCGSGTRQWLRVSREAAVRVP